MCGNYNHNSSDDNLMPNKKPAKDVIELGNSWLSDENSDPGSVVPSAITHGSLCVVTLQKQKTYSHWGASIPVLA